MPCILPRIGVKVRIEQRRQSVVRRAASAGRKAQAAMRRFRTELAPEAGQDMIEYALLAALISIATISIVLLIGPYLADMFEDVVNAFGSA